MSYTAHVVIGANHGDEGKGHMVDDIIRTCYGQEKSIVVRYSGGAQAGHTVIDRDTNTSHVFKHIGAGWFAGADTWLADEFIVNPMLFNPEYNDLITKTSHKPHIMISPNARVTTPYDILMNLINEEQRGGVGKHGSCGCGIHETMMRHEEIEFTWKMASKLSDDDIRLKLDAIRDYHKDRCNRLYGFVDEAFDQKIDLQYIDDIRNMLYVTYVVDFPIISRDYRNFVFEGSQGLLLDEKYGTFPHLTPASVGLEVPMEYVEAMATTANPVQVYSHYVSRVYMTRHGNGPMEYECSPETLNVNHPTETNVFNDNQGKFRYGILDVDAMVTRSQVDSLCAIPVVRRNNGLIDVKGGPIFTCQDHIDAKFVPVIIKGKRFNLNPYLIQEYVNCHYLKS